MFLMLIHWLHLNTKYSNIFHFLIYRAIMANITALVSVFILGPTIIKKIISMKINQTVRFDGPQTHFKKSGTPTMGGILILISIIISVLLWANLANDFIWIVLLITVSFSIIGFIDDYRKIIFKSSKGMSSYEKYFWQSLIGILSSIYIVFLISQNNCSSFIHWINSDFPLKLLNNIKLFLPFYKHSYTLSVLGFIILSYLVIVGSSNAVNLTDGLDGLVIIPIILVSFTLGVFAYLTGNIMYSCSLLFPNIPGVDELLIFCAAISGSSLAFLWYNIYPAKIFMGDVGALALGSAIGTIAVIIRQEIMLFIIGGLFVVETISVILQVGWFKFTKFYFGIGHRIFKMAPLHHHFELCGWKEKQIVIRFWFMTLILVLFGLFSLKLR